MIFKTLQTYSDGTVVRWIDEPATDGTEPESPAPVLKLAAAGTGAEATAAPAATAAAAPAGESSGDGMGTTFGIIGAVLGLAALILALLAYRRAGRTAAADPGAGRPETVSAGRAG
jgi:hypothetical protein